MVPKKDVSLAEEKDFKLDSSLFQTSSKSNVRNSREHPNNSRKDKTAEGKVLKILRLTEVTW